MHNLEVPAGFLWGLPDKSRGYHGGHCGFVRHCGLVRSGDTDASQGLGAPRVQPCPRPPPPAPPLGPAPGLPLAAVRTGEPRATPLGQYGSRSACGAGPAREGGGACGEAGPRLIRGGLVSGRGSPPKGGAGAWAPRAAFASVGARPREHGAAPRAKVAPGLGGCTVASGTVPRVLGLPWRGGDRAQRPAVALPLRGSARLGDRWC